MRTDVVRVIFSRLNEQIRPAEEAHVHKLWDLAVQITADLDRNDMLIPLGTHPQALDPAINPFA